MQTTILDAEGIVRRQVYGMDYDTPILIEPIKRLIFGEQVSEGFFQRMTNKFRLFCTVYDPASDRYRFNYSIYRGHRDGRRDGNLLHLSCWCGSGGTAGAPGSDTH